MNDVADALVHLQRALESLDEAGEYVAAAFVASAIDALNPPTCLDDADYG